MAISTAHAYKTGRLKPSKPAQKLFRLYRDRLVLTAEWEGWAIKKDRIVDPENNEIDRKHLRNISFIAQFFTELVRRADDPAEVESLWRLLRAA